MDDQRVAWVYGIRSRRYVMWVKPTFTKLELASEVTLYRHTR